MELTYLLKPAAISPDFAGSLATAVFTLSGSNRAPRYFGPTLFRSLFVTVSILVIISLLKEHSPFINA